MALSSDGMGEPRSLASAQRCGRAADQPSSPGETRSTRVLSTSRASGKVFECDWVHVFRIRGARVASFWGMLDTEAAAAARS